MRATRISKSLACLILCAMPALASGPRYVAALPYFTGVGAGTIVVWPVGTVLYSTDPAALSPYVTHAQADALVAAAAAVWSVPVANIGLSQGGQLAEHVSGTNVYLSSSGIVYPADVESTNHASIPIAVIYDTDGSVTDTLLGGGASDPAGCRQHGVTESVDLFSTSGKIQHAVVILNGRCTGPAPEQQLQMQYQLERAFGRVLGLAWSQTNENVFSGSPAPTVQQAANWPILHPIDILCGLYSYQCLPSPFQLREDDIASLEELYPIPLSNVAPPPGKVVGLNQGSNLQGIVSFPTGQGMAGVNIEVQRWDVYQNAPEPYSAISGLSGALYRRLNATPIAAISSSMGSPGMDGSEGTTDVTREGLIGPLYLQLPATEVYDGAVITTEPVNPLYIGSYSLGIYGLGAVAPSGPVTSAGSAGDYYYNVPIILNIPVTGASASCGDGTDGTAAAPVPPASSGWWTGLICGYGHAAWTALAVRPGDTLTVEITALNESGHATTTKAMPIVGAWAATDSTSAPPTLGAVTAAFNSTSIGMTSMTLATGTATGLQIAVADERGDGRPDFAYQQRVFYANAITPSVVAASGSTATIGGLGFRPGNAVSVNGVAAPAVSWTANSIVVTLPTMAAAGATAGVPVSVTVRDLSTGATTTMASALTYTTAATAPHTMALVSAQRDPVYVGSVATIPFAVQVLAGDGVTPIAGDSVTFSGNVAGSATALQFGACAAASCVVTTDVQGMASTTVTPLSGGLLTMRAVDSSSAPSLSQAASFTAIAQAGSMVVNTAPSGTIYVSVSAVSPFSVTEFKSDGKTPYAGRQVTFTTTLGGATFDACALATCVVTTNSAGVASSGVTATAAGPVGLQAADGNLSQKASFTALADTPQLIVTSVPTGSFTPNTTAGWFRVIVMQPDGVTPIPYAPLVFTAVPVSNGATPAGVIIAPCLTPVCTMSAFASGEGDVTVVVRDSGDYLISVSYGGVTKSYPLTVASSNQPLLLHIVSAPAGNQPVGKPLPTSFSVQLQLPNGSPATGYPVIVNGEPGEVILNACNLYRCTLVTDGNGMVSTTVTALALGLLTLQAAVVSTVSTQFTGVVNGDTLHVVAFPTPVVIDEWTPNSFEVQAMESDGVTPAAGRSIKLDTTQGLAVFGDCYQASCPYVTDAHGMVIEQIYVYGPGTIPITVTEGGNILNTSLYVATPPDILRLVTAPLSTVPVNTTAAAPFTIQAALWNGVTPLAGKNIAFSVTAGTAILGACGASSCIVTTDSNGNASTTVEPLAVGKISLLAADGTATLTTSFTAGNAPDVLQLVTAPVGPVFVGNAAAPAFAVMVMAGGTLTPIAGRNIVFSVTGGSASLSGCVLATCTVVSDATGSASVTVTPTSAGTLSLQAADGAIVEAATLLAQANIQTLASSQTQLYLASGATIAWTPSVTGSLNGSLDPGVTVTWTGSTGFTFTGSTSTTSASGVASMAATLGPLAAGATASASACGWTKVCAQFTALAVSSSAFAVQIVAGGNQTATGGVALHPVTAQVTDSAGDPVAGAAVTILQTVTEQQTPCPVHGRCPAAPVLAQATTQATSDSAGLVAITPLTVNGVPTATNIAVTAGTSGFATAVLSRSP